MKTWQKANAIVFFTIIISLTIFVYTMDIPNSSGKPWHLQPSVHEDSLSQEYLRNYKIISHKSLLKQFFNHSKTNVFILVDAWGVPINEKQLANEFDFFAKTPHIYALHQRYANRTKHAERVEFRNKVSNGIYLFGGDSLEYDRPKYIAEIGFNRTLFCQKCEDSVMIAKIDSILKIDTFQLIAWTTQSSRKGDIASLHKSLKLIADFAEQHHNVQIIMQGTHRPILSDSEIRNSYKSHWVPVVILNN